MLLSPSFLQRLAATVGLFTRYGLSDFAAQQGLRGLARDDASDRDTDGGDATAFRERLVELGPAYIKLGQVLSTRPDLLPASYIEELESLQDDLEPISTAEIMQIVEDELGGRISKLFESFDEQPLGTASLGQAHAATLR